MREEDLNQPWKIENLRRSIAMLPARAPGLSREDTLLVLELLAEARSTQPSGGGVGDFPG